MSLKQMQDDTDKWISQFDDGYWTPAEQIVCLAEEVGELAREVNHLHGPKQKKSSEPDGNMGEEIADILFVLACLANDRGIDLDEAWRKGMDKRNARDTPRFSQK